MLVDVNECAVGVAKKYDISKDAKKMYESISNETYLKQLENADYSLTKTMLTTTFKPMFNKLLKTSGDGYIE